MFFRNKVIGLGLVVDTRGNIDIGFYNKKSVEIFGINYTVAGDKYFGTKKKSLNHGVGVLQNSNKWKFGYLVDGQMKKVLFERKKNLKSTHFRINEILTSLIYRAFGGYRKAFRKLGKLILKNHNPVISR
jgi:hypothetical protein